MDVGEDHGPEEHQRSRRRRPGRAESASDSEEDSTRPPRRDADLDRRISQVKRWGVYIVAVLVLLPRPLVIPLVVLMGLVYMCIAVFS